MTDHVLEVLTALFICINALVTAYNTWRHGELEREVRNSLKVLGPDDD